MISQTQIEHIQKIVRNSYEGLTIELLKAFQSIFDYSDWSSSRFF